MASTASVDHKVELDVVIDGMLDRVDFGAVRELPAEARALVAGSLYGANFVGVSSVRVVNPHGPGGANPTIEFGGTKDGLNALLSDYFSADPELYNLYKIV